MRQVNHIDGVIISKITSFEDTRGKFSKFLPGDTLNNNLNAIAISTNLQKGTLRGLHFQLEPFAEEKLVTCLNGSIFDVLVDLRPSSNTFQNWTTFELNESNLTQIYIPKGVAHGFQSLTDFSQILYCITSLYSKPNSFSINPFCELNIQWPIAQHIISDQDSNGLTFKNAVAKYAASLVI
jgi:dTDP-4-dehydrorhamnose 3,5-epimerase